MEDLNKTTIEIWSEIWWNSKSCRKLLKDMIELSLYDIPWYKLWREKNMKINQQNALFVLCYIRLKNINSELQDAKKSIWEFAFSL